MHWMEGYGHMGWAGGGFMGLMMLLGTLFWIALFVLILVAIMRLWPQPSRREDDALSLLRQRYARGEIDQEEYERKRRDLLGS